MSESGSRLTDSKKLLQAMAAEAQKLKRASGGSATETGAAWVAPQYLLAARDKLKAGGGPGRFEVLRMFVQDWAVLRHGDHMAERLQIERERLELSKQDAQKRWQTKLAAGLEAVGEGFKRKPELMDPYLALLEKLYPEPPPPQEHQFWEWLRRPEFRQRALTELTRYLSPETQEKIQSELHWADAEPGSVDGAPPRPSRPMSLVAADVRRLIPGWAGEVRLSLRRLLRFRGSKREFAVGFLSPIEAERKVE